MVLKVKVTDNTCNLKEIGVDEISLQNGNDAYSPHSYVFFFALEKASFATCSFNLFTVPKLDGDV